MVDWSNVLEATSTVPVERVSPHLRKLFGARYQDMEEARWRYNRILAAFRYMKANVAPFEKAGFLLASSKGGNVWPDLSMALCGFFGQVDDNEVLNPPRAEVFIHTLEEFRRLIKRT